MPNRSIVWRYFQKISPNSARCQLCNKILQTSGNTSNLRCHLDKIHGHELTQESDEDPQPTMRQTNIPDFAVENQDCLHEVQDPNIPTTSKNASAVNHSTSENTTDTQLVQPTVDAMFEKIKNTSSKDGTRHQKITEAIVNFIVLDNKPFSVVEGKGFLQLMKQTVPLYKVPSRETFKARIDEKYMVMSSIFKQSLQKVEYYSLTYDVWTEVMQTKSFVGVTIHFLQNAKHVSGTIGIFELTESHTEDYLKKELTRIFNDWGICDKKVMAVVSDNDSTMLKLSRELFGEKKIISCFAHSTNLVVTNALDNSPDVSSVITHVRNIVKFIKRSVNASDELRKKQTKAGVPEGQIKKMILDVKTRWNSCFYMLQRFVELAGFIPDILLSRSDAPPMVSGNELDIIRETIEILQPFEKITKELSAENYVTVSKVIPLVNCVRDVLRTKNSKHNCTIRLKDELQKQIDKRFNRLEHHSIIALATVLDPRFKTLHLQDPLAKCAVINNLNAFLERLDGTVGSENTTMDQCDPESHESREFDLWEYHKRLTLHNLKQRQQPTTPFDRYMSSEVQMYLKSPVNPLHMKQNGIEVWEDLKTLYPNLYKIALQYLPIVATSVPSERLFSKAGATITQARNRLSGKRLSKLLFLNTMDSVCNM